MQLTINLPDREQSLSFHRQRWEEVMSDSRWRDCVERIETNAWGQIIMTPPPRYIHSRRQAKIASMIESFVGGYSATECGIITSDGVKVADVTWLSESSFKRLGQQAVLEEAAEICVEILSPSNTSVEIENKFRLYFDAGATECWQCDLEGRMSYYEASDPEKAKAESILCPEFPNQIGD